LQLRLWLLKFKFPQLLVNSKRTIIALLQDHINLQKYCRLWVYEAQLKGSVKEPNILIYFFFPPITQSCSVSDVLFTGGRGVSDSSVLKYY